LTARGIDLAPILAEMVLRAAGHEDTGNQALVHKYKRTKNNFCGQCGNVGLENEPLKS
jgi:hypothetical protein